MILKSAGRYMAATALALLALANSHAATFTKLDTQASRIGFGYSQMGVSMEGAFNTLDAKAFSFDTDQPQNARVEIELPLAGIDAGYDEANAELAQKDWLDTPQHPLAGFESTKVTPMGNDHYEVTGVLSIKGRQKEVTVPFEFKQAEGTGIFEGSFEIQRADFGIGEGQWADFGIVANTIRIKFYLVATP